VSKVNGSSLRRVVPCVPVNNCMSCVALSHLYRYSTVISTDAVCLSGAFLFYRSFRSIGPTYFPNLGRGGMPDSDSDLLGMIARMVSGYRYVLRTSWVSGSKSSSPGPSHLSPNNLQRLALPFRHTTRNIVNPHKRCLTKRVAQRTAQKDCQHQQQQQHPPSSRVHLLGARQAPGS
jgi:hypothetical protein